MTVDFERVKEVGGVDGNAIDSRELVEKSKAHREPSGDAVCRVTKYSDVARAVISVCLGLVMSFVVLIENLLLHGPI